MSIRDRPIDRNFESEMKRESTPGGQNQEKVEDRPNVGTTTPDKYPDKARGENR